MVGKYTIILLDGLPAHYAPPHVLRNNTTANTAPTTDAFLALVEFRIFIGITRRGIVYEDQFTN